MLNDTGHTTGLVGTFVAYFQIKMIGYQAEEFGVGTIQS